MLIVIDFQVAIKAYSINTSQTGPPRMPRTAFPSCTTQHQQRRTRTCLHLKSMQFEVIDLNDRLNLYFLFRYNQNIKILHFIGETKPWNQHFDSSTRHVQSPEGYSHLQAFLQLWWDLFCANVHPELTEEMVS